MSGPGPQGGNGRVGIVENWELRQGKQQDANSGAFKGIAFVAVALVLIVVGGWYAARPMVGPAVEGIFEDNPGIVGVPLVSDLLAAEFGDRIDTPAAGGNVEAEFVVGSDIAPGTALDVVQADLVEQGLLDDEAAFRYAMARDSVDELIRPGTFTLTPPITPASIADRLALPPDPPTPVVALDMRVQRRLEQTVAYLQQEVEDPEVALELDPNEFKRLARNPTNKLRNDYPFLSTLPKGNTLEGYLYPGTYEVEVDITAEELLRLMLDKWDERMSKYVRQANNKGVDFYEALTIASLVEREARADKDRRKIAGVYWNRLDPKLAKKAGTNGLLQADPTVVYATDSMALEDIGLKDWDEYVFWDLLGLADYSTVDVDAKYASYQTYQNPGLPDSPIVTPAAPSMEAALNPATRGGNMFFYACPDSTTHKFAKNANKHLRNINSCE
ncbi:MAG: endolytic transglycosylase MltG [Candidatus Limnocylindrales bacterium]